MFVFWGIYCILFYWLEIVKKSNKEPLLFSNYRCYGLCSTNLYPQPLSHWGATCWNYYFLFEQKFSNVSIFCVSSVFFTSILNLLCLLFYNFLTIFCMLNTVNNTSVTFLFSGSHVWLVMVRPRWPWWLGHLTPWCWLHLRAGYFGDFQSRKRPNFGLESPPAGDGGSKTLFIGWE